jgi:Fe2+ or Zn2+ uptake regulation protein
VIRITAYYCDMQTQPESEIRDAGLRVTAGRVAVLQTLESAPHSDAEAVFRSIAPTLPGTSIQSVYNMLNDLTGAGLLRRIEPEGSNARYERRVGDNHHHVVCSGCGAVGDVECVVGGAPCLEPSNTGGFTVNTAEVTFWGLCPDCQ